MYDYFLLKLPISLFQMAQEILLNLCKKWLKCMNQGPEKPRFQVDSRQFQVEVLFFFHFNEEEKKKMNHPHLSETESVSIWGRTMHSKSTLA